jgi:hypothetical protein
MRKLRTTGPDHWVEDGSDAFSPNLSKIAGAGAIRLKPQDRGPA